LIDGGNRDKRFILFEKEREFANCPYGLVVPVASLFTLVVRGFGCFQWISGLANKISSQCAISMRIHVRNFRWSFFVLLLLPFIAACPQHGSGARVVNFKEGSWPGVILKAQGLSSPEPWGTWSSGDAVTLAFATPLPKRFTVSLLASAFGPNAGKEFVVHVGDGVGRFELGSASREEKVLQFDNPAESSTMKIDVPSPTSPKELGLSGDTRSLGIALVELRISPL